MRAAVDPAPVHGSANPPALSGHVGAALAAIRAQGLKRGHRGYNTAQRGTSAALREQERTGFPALGHTLPSSAGIDGLLGLDFLCGQSLTLSNGRVTLA
jgi:hypothetical protein